MDEVTVSSPHWQCYDATLVSSFPTADEEGYCNLSDEKITVSQNQRADESATALKQGAKNTL